MFWIVGKTGLLSRAFQRYFLSHSTPFFVSSQQECDIRELQHIEKFIRGKECQYLINCSGYTAVDLAERHPEEAYALNATGVNYLAQIAEKMHAKLIHFSTDYVFNGKKNISYTEEDPPSPVNVYGASKLQGENILKERFPSALIMRISWLFSQEGLSFTQAMWKAFLEKEEVEVVTTQVSKPTYAEDVVTAVQEVLEAQGVYHFANHGAISRYTYAQEIFSELKNQGVLLKCKRIIPIEHLPGSVPRPEYSALSTAKIEPLLRAPIRSHQEALREYIAARISKERQGVA